MPTYAVTRIERLNPRGFGSDGKFDRIQSCRGGTTLLAFETNSICTHFWTVRTFSEHEGVETKLPGVTKEQARWPRDFCEAMYSWAKRKVRGTTVVRYKYATNTRTVLTKLIYEHVGGGRSDDQASCEWCEPNDVDGLSITSWWKVPITTCHRYLILDRNDGFLSYHLPS